jgi:GTP-binding protein
MEIRDARFLLSATSVEGLPPPAHPEIAFAGRSNVGKSSLINALLRRKKLVRTSQTPGQTRALNVFRADLVAPAATVDFVDLPGYGFAARSKAERRSWKEMIEAFLERRVGLAAVVVIVDARRGIGDDDAQLLDYLDHLGRTAIVAATKVDKLRTSERGPAVAAIRKAAGKGRRVIATSAETGEGRDGLAAAMLACTGLALPEPRPAAT